MLIVSCRVHFETRVGLMREVQAVVSRAGKRNSPHKIIREKKDDNKHWANVGLIGGIRKASLLVWGRNLGFAGLCLAALWPRCE